VSNSVTSVSSANLRISNDILAKASAFVDRSAEQFLLTGKDKSVLGLTIEELVSNCIKHGDMGSGDEIQLTLMATRCELILQISDCGVSFNPLLDLANNKQQYQIPDSYWVEGSVENRKPGGLGWPIINHFCEIIDYSRKNHRNNLVLRYSRGP
jgi:anti-sigma regulatory factor (Ser/Thr protein kinase)